LKCSGNHSGANYLKIGTASMAGGENPLSRRIDNAGQEGRGKIKYEKCCNNCCDCNE